MDILKDLTGITGEGFVTDDESVLSGYASDLSFSAGTKPEAEVCPGTTEEVSRIVKWANENNMPLIPVSSPGAICTEVPNSRNREASRAI